MMVNINALTLASRVALVTLLVLVNLGAVWAQSATSVRSSQVSEDYTISPNDRLDIRVLNDPEGSGEVRVSKKGSVRHSYMGDLKLAGLTESQAASKLAAALRDGYLVNPKVTVSVVDYAKIRFTVLGAVNGPDTYEVPANKRITIIEAIAVAKGFKDEAKRTRVTLSRAINGQVKPWTVNVKAMMANSRKQQPVFIQDGDVINVPTSRF